MKNVLLISYHFPPSTAVGGVRTSRFAKYLVGYGWNPVVLTIKDKHIENLDLGRLEGFENIRIVKVGKIFKLSRFYIPLKRFLRVEGKNGKPASAEPLPLLGKSGTTGSETLYKRLRRYIRAFMALPDQERNWIFPAVYAAIREVRKSNIDCMLTSCPPYSSHLVGLIVKTVTGVGWVADYRDPWTITGKKTVVSTCEMSLAIERWLEERVIRRADTILANTERMVTAYKTRGVSEGAGKFVYLPNMIDREMYDGFCRLEKYPVFTISYTGSLYFGRSPEPLFAAIRELLIEGRIHRGEIQVKLVGHCDRIDGTPVTDVVHRYGLESSVDVTGLVSHVTALEIARRSHLGLLLAPDQPLQIPAKMYEYMGLGTRVLAIAKNGATKDLVSTSGCGRAFDPSDIGGIKSYLLDSMGQRQLDIREGNGKAIEQFEVSNVVRKLATELDKLCVGTA